MDDWSDLGAVPEAADDWSDLGAVTDNVEDTRIDMDAYQPREMAPWESAVQGFRDEAMMGFGNEATAGWGTLLEKLSGSDKSWGELYDEELATAQGANIEASKQNPDAYTAGQAGGLAASAVVPMSVPGGAAVTKGAGKLLAKGKGIVDDAIGEGAKKARKAVVESDLIKAVVGDEKAARLAKAAKGLTPNTMGDVASMAAGAAVSPVNPIMGAATGLGIKRVADKGAAGLASNKAKRDARKATAKQVSERMKAAKDAVGEGADVETLFGRSTGLEAQIAKEEKRMRRIERLNQRDYIGRGAEKIDEFYNLYGDDMANWAARGTNALIANTFIRSQQDPEFRMRKKAAEEEATRLDEENSE